MRIKVKLSNWIYDDENKDNGENKRENINVIKKVKSMKINRWIFMAF